MPLHSLVYLALTGCHVHLWCSLAHIFHINNILDFEKWGSVIAWRHSVVPKNWPLCAHGLLQEDAHGLFGLFWWMPVGRTAASKGIRIIRMIHVHYRLHTPLTMLFARGLFKWDSIFPGVRSTSCKGQNQIMLLSTHQRKSGYQTIKRALEHRIKSESNDISLWVQWLFSRNLFKKAGTWW